MKKLILFLIVGVLFSCSNSNEDVLQTGNIINPKFDVNKMIGAWVNQTVKVNGQVFDYEHREHCGIDVFAFYNREGNPYEYHENVYTDDNCASHGITLEWKVKENMLIFFFGENLVLTYEVISIDDTYFTVLTSDDYDNDGTIDTIEITAKREDPYGWFD
ncbi:hypothetical protein MC378_13970 [Polaribacter sp. MSW13]|uniref:Lipocalin-like domain-containing protein n=1 Tax=Polaribacter marinus TaxID=2916838 RepID=A0A9X1VVB6_9FLAO|nr:hypothetical protein [Polaribacter marinus]MCI2230281.1 hypothetical protein [Polaribacter marinus]